jgi:hypothetical protein
MLQKNLFFPNFVRAYLKKNRREPILLPFRHLFLSLHFLKFTTVWESNDDRLACCVLQASQLYERAISGVLSTCALLYFAYADFEEQNMKYEKVHTIYQKYLDHQARDCT